MDFVDIRFPEGARFAFLADLQRTGLVERLLFREQNDPERERLVSAILEARPAVVFLLGDLVFWGGSRRAWAYFDDLVRPLREAGIELWPILGNHDCWSVGPAALRHFYERFPRLERRRWYMAKLGPLAIVALDSNRLWMPRFLWEQQIAWYERALAELDDDPSIRGVLVLVHHPPYTNGTVTGPSALVDRNFVMAFLRGRKTLGMFSGHVHAYEHFSRQNRHFVVCGGGGGPRHALLPPERRVFHDLFMGPTLRDFHFLLLEPNSKNVDVQVVGLEKGAPRARPIDRFQMVFSD